MSTPFANGFPIGLPMKHDSFVSGAVFNKDETHILAWSEFGKARLWNIEVDEDFPKKYLQLMVKVVTATSIDDYGNIITLSKNEWEKYKENYIRIAEEHEKVCKHKNANIYLNHQKPNWNKK